MHLRIHDRRRECECIQSARTFHSNYDAVQTTICLVWKYRVKEIAWRKYCAPNDILDRIKIKIRSYAN